jgi:hypothetical protein
MSKNAWAIARRFGYASIVLRLAAFILAAFVAFCAYFLARRLADALRDRTFQIKPFALFEHRSAFWLGVYIQGVIVIVLAGAMVALLGIGLTGAPIG